jgi:hypothetical protein
MNNHIDLSQVPDGFKIKGGVLFDREGKFVGPVPRKDYNSQEERRTELEESDIDKPKLKLWSDFNKEVFPEPKWKIQNILPYEGLTIIASPSGEKKTWIAMNMACSIANGTNFLDHTDFKTEEGAVIYIDQEMSKTEIQRRGRLLGLHETKFPVYLYDKEDDINFKNEEDVDDLISIVEESKAKVIFIDTLRSVAGGLNEDKAEDVRAFLDKFKPFKDKGVVVVFLDHCRKPNHIEGKIPKKEQLLGSQDKVASVEVLLMIKSDEETKEILVYVRKCRNGIEYTPFKVEMRDEINDCCDVIKVKLTYAGLIEEKEYKIDQAKNMILDFLSQAPKKRKEIIKALIPQKIGEKNISEGLRQLEKEKKIVSKKDGRENVYSLVDSGDTPEEYEQNKLDDF